MSQSVGSLEVRVEGLSGAQETALAALRAGRTFVKAAEAAGVSRVTVYRWVRDDPHFRAAYNAWQQEAAESARARLVKLADMAVDVVERALRRDDEKVALKVLRGVGAMRKKRKESTSAQVLDLQMKVRDGRELRRAEMGMLQHLMQRMGMPARERKHVLSGRRGASEYREEILKELERRGVAERAAGNVEPTAPTAPPRGSTDDSGNVTSQKPPAERTDEATGATNPDNPLPIQEMHSGRSPHEASEGDVTSDVAPQGMLHESVA